MEPAGSLAARQPGRPLGAIATMLGSAASNQVGAAAGALAFGAIGPVGVVAVRQFIAAAVLVPLARPRFRTLTRAQWWPIAWLAVVFGLMNLTLYAAIDRLGLALGVTLEFLGPLAVALATARSRLAVLCGVVVGGGVVILTAPRPSSDFLGIGLGLASAAAWAAYILLNRVVGERVPGLRGTSAAASLSAVAWIPVAVIIFTLRPPSPAAIGLALACGIGSSAIPYVADLVSLRRVPTDMFGIFMSCHPVLAALAGYLMLGQVLLPNELAGIAVIVASNVAITVWHRPG